MILDDIELSLLSHVNYDFAIKYNILPIRRYGDGIIIICSDVNKKVLDDLKLMFNDNIVPYIQSEEVVRDNIKYYYEMYNKRQEKETGKSSEDFYEELFKTAIDMNASDIHIEPQLEEVKIRFRINGQLTLFKKISFNLYNFISTKIKVLSNLDITERRMSQDGKMSYNYSGKKYNIRVSTILISKGEKISLRVHYNTIINKDIDELGFSEEQVEILKKQLSKKSGMTIVAGPTGSGKSTTLYKFLEYLNTENVSIYTIEDPVEYEISGINQSSINSRAGLTFDGIAKSILRHDPDILMIGEIRDEETAKVSIESSIVGHKVFSTIHARDTISVITRLIELGILEGVVLDSLNLIISQRLMGKLCLCKKKQKIEELYIFDRKYEEGKYYSPKGCEKCNFTGYNGRILLSEILIIDDIIRDMLLDKRSIQEIKSYIKEKYFDFSFDYNLRNLIEDGQVYILDAEALR